MKYCIIGVGGTGGPTGAKLAQAGKDVTLIARGKSLAALQENGITIRHLWDGETVQVPVRACTSDDYLALPEEKKADVILVCVKGYSLDSILPFLQKAVRPGTIVLPVLNIYGTGAKLQEKLPEADVLDGCIYVSAAQEAPGVLVQHGPIHRIVFGPRNHQVQSPAYLQIAQDLRDSGISGELSDNIQRDALEKFSYVSPIGAAGLYCNAVAGDFQKEGPARELFIRMIREVSALADAMGCPFERDYVPVNLEILSHLSADATTSMQRDVMAGHPSEIDGLVLEVVRMGHRWNVPVPAYEMVAAELKKRGVC